jgi:hypothetical protein
MSENAENIEFEVEKRHELTEIVFTDDELPDSQTVETLTEDEYLALLTALYCD